VASLFQLCDYAAAEIDRLTAEGIQPSPAEIVELNAICARSGADGARIALSRGKPVFLGNVALWPLTIRAFSWLEEGGWEGGTFAIAWAMAHAYVPGVFDRPLAWAKKEIKTWARRLDATLAAVDAAVAEVLAADEENDPPDARTDEEKAADGNLKAAWGELVARLVAVAGGTPELWETRVSCSYALTQLSIALAQAKADGKPAANSPTLLQERAIAVCLAKIRARAKAEAEAGNAK
jgi:hypothetical protein